MFIADCDPSEHPPPPSLGFRSCSPLSLPSHALRPACKGGSQCHMYWAPCLVFMIPSLTFMTLCAIDGCEWAPHVSPCCPAPRRTGPRSARASRRVAYRQQARRQTAACRCRRDRDRNMTAAPPRCCGAVLRSSRRVPSPWSPNTSLPHPSYPITAKHESLESNGTVWSQVREVRQVGEKFGKMSGSPVSSHALPKQ